MACCWVVCCYKNRSTPLKNNRGFKTILKELWVWRFSLGFFVTKHPPTIRQAPADHSGTTSVVKFLVYITKLAQPAHHMAILRNSRRFKTFSRTGEYQTTPKTKSPADYDVALYPKDDLLLPLSQTDVAFLMSHISTPQCRFT